MGDMAEIRIKKRRRLRNREVRALASELSERMGLEAFSSETIVDIAESNEFEVLFVDGQILAIVYDGRAFPTVRGLLRWGAARYFVTVDMGAVPYVYNGADVMSPGIVEVDPDIQEGDLVWVRDERNRRPLAIGKALLPAKSMLDKASGKAVASIHHVGDKLWKLDEE